MATRRSKKREPEAKRELHYKVVELSSVDEATLERTLNEWTPRGWLVNYSTDDGEPLGSSTDATHPSLALLGLADEARVIDVAMAWLWALDFGE